MKRLISMLMIFCMMCGLTGVRADEMLEANVVLKFNAPGNIYFTGDNDTLVATYVNNSASGLEFDVSFIATGRKYSGVWSYENSVSLSAYSSTKENISIDFAKDIGVYDIYDLVVTLSDGSKTKTVRTEFSYVKRGVKNDNFGINTHFITQDYSPYFKDAISILKKSGVSIVRDSVSSWSVYESEKGNYQMPDNYKNMMNTLIENDIEILHVLAYGNTLYTASHGTIPVKSDEVAGFVNYAKELVRETKGKVKYFEIWNEPNAGAGFNDGNDDGTGYGNLVKAVYPAIKEINPNAYVMGYSSSGYNDRVNKTASTGAYNYMDAATFHPYPEYDPTGKTTWATGTQLPEARTISFNDQFRNRAKRDNLWITEQGWSDGNNVNAEALPPAYLVRAYTLMMADGNVEKYFWYELIRAATDNDYESKFGILNGRLQNLPLSARPTFLAMSNMNSKLANTEFLKYTTTNDVYKCDFKKSSGDDLSVIWLKTNDENASKSQSFNFGCKRLLQTDIYGNEEILTSKTGVYELDADCDPAYYEPLEDEVEKFEYKYNTQTGICTIKGYIDAKTENIPVNMMLYRPNKVYEDLTEENEMETLSYFDQCLTSVEGVYGFEFSPADGEGVYLLKLASEDGETFETYIDLRSNLTCTAEVKDKSIDDIKTGERFSVKVSVTGENKVYKEYNVYVALFNGDKLVKVCGKPGEVMDDVLSNVTELEMTADYEFDTIKAFAWEPDMKPIGKSVTIPKTK